MSSCAASGEEWTCSKEVWSRGLCKGHYQRLQRGQPLSPLRHYRPKVASIHDLASWCAEAAEPDAGCLMWTRALKNGYGAVRFESTQYAVHRLVYEAKHGRLPPGSVVHHVCGRKACINVDHLRAVTPAENTAESLDRRALLLRIEELEQRIKEIEEEAP